MIPGAIVPATSISCHNIVEIFQNFQSQSDNKTDLGLDGKVISG